MHGHHQTGGKHDIFIHRLVSRILAGPHGRVFSRVHSLYHSRHWLISVELLSDGLVGKPSHFRQDDGKSDAVQIMHLLSRRRFCPFQVSQGANCRVAEMFQLSQGRGAKDECEKMQLRSGRGQVLRIHALMSSELLTLGCWSVPCTLRGICSCFLDSLLSLAVITC